MPISTHKLITLTRVNADHSVSAYYPKTVSSQVFVTANTTVYDHVTDTNIHLSSAERAMFTNLNQANGLVQLDTNGWVPTANINPAVLAITTEFATTAAMCAGASGVKEGQLVWVNDASGDSTVTSGWAIYRKKVQTDPATYDYTVVNDVPESSEGAGDGKITGWCKVAESEGLDVVVQWANIQGKPNSTPTQIDQAVTDDHTHSNKAALDDLADATTGTAPNEVVGLTYKGEAVAFQSEVSHLALSTEANVDTTAAAMAENDIIFVVTNDNYSFPV